ncbi:hypothetical protein COU74_00660 [Candidatus Peregrinibacteria bacterium CG10_big_fil_rev_8_21_14_0_10_36_19]|nr:MAG: hypothetical protein COU74_00660 [Candidatus Peregrinibacteria bacterium CG10_big_fil_rev_8_21_14_0_10_36_19]
MNKNIININGVGIDAEAHDIESIQPSINKVTNLIKMICDRFINSGEHSISFEHVNGLFYAKLNSVSLDRQEQFCKRMIDLLETFFCFDFHDPSSIANDINELVHLIVGQDVGDLGHVGEDVATIEDFTRLVSKKKKEFVASKLDEVGRPSELVGLIFVSENQLAKSEVLQRIGSLDIDNPRLIEMLINSVDKIKKDQVFKPMFLGIVKSVINDYVKGEFSEYISLLDQITVFLETMRKRKITLADLKLLSYFVDNFSFDEAAELVNANDAFMSSLVKSVYNGGHIVRNDYVRRMESSATSETFIKGLDDHAMQNLFSIFMKVANGEINVNEIDFQVGIGGFEHGVPLRILSYLVPSLTIANRFFAKYGDSPKISFFTGQHGAIYCNGFDKETVQKRTTNSFNFAGGFVKKFFPNLVGNFEFVNDVPWEEPKMGAMLEYFEKLLLEELGHDAKITNLVGELRKRGARYGGEVGEMNALKYAAFHVICFRDIPIIDAYVKGGDVFKGRNFITFGGKAELSFDLVRSKLVEKFTVSGFNEFVESKGNAHLKIVDDVQSASLETRSTVIMDSGDIPPYFLVDKVGDVAVEDLKANSPADVGKVIANMVRSVILFHRTSEDKKTVVAAGSVVDSMALLATAVSPYELANFVYNFKNESK